VKRKNKLIAISLVITFISFLCFAQENESRIADKTINSNSSSLQKSLLIPGWGQIAEKRYIEGALFLASEIFCVYKIVSYNRKGNYYYDLYKEVNCVKDAIRYRELTKKYDIRRNKFIFIAASIWALNLMDIYFIIKSKEKKKDNIKLIMQINEEKKISFSISYNF